MAMTANILFLGFQKTKIETNGIVSIQRDAAHPVQCTRGRRNCRIDRSDHETKTVCCCTSSLCNGVSSLRQKPFIVFITMNILIMITYRWI